MLYKHSDLAFQLRDAHPALRDVLAGLEVQLRAWGLPSFTITEIDRTWAENASIYFKLYTSQGMSPAAARKKADSRKSWHIIKGCAVDFRNKAYTKDENDMVLVWLRQRCPTKKGEWEVLLHNAGTGIHFHVARCDAAWDRPKPGDS